MAEALPVYAYPFSGNANDISEFPAFIANSAATLKGMCPNLKYMVCDSAGATYKAASACREAGLHLITRLPDSTTAVQEAFKKAKNGQVEWKELVLSGGDDKEDKVIVQVAEVGPHALKSRKKCGKKAIEGKMLLVNAESMRSKKTETVNHKADRELKKASAELNAFVTMCHPDAIKLVDKVRARLKFCTISHVEVVAEPRYNKRGRPKKGAKPDSMEYHVKAELERDETAIMEAIDQELLYVLWTTDPDATSWTIYGNYHHQADVEGGWKSIKDPLRFANSFYVKSAKRMAAYSIMETLALLVRRLVSNNIRDIITRLRLKLPRLSHNRPTRSPHWSTIELGFKLAGLYFDLERNELRANDDEYFEPPVALQILDEALDEVAKLFDSRHLSQYVEAIQRGHANFRAFIARLTKGDPVCYKSPLRQPARMQSEKNTC